MPDHALALTEHEQRHLQAVQAHLGRLVQQRQRRQTGQGGFPAGCMPFDEWMGHALYAPQLGYYSSNRHQIASPARIGSDGTPNERNGKESSQGDFKGDFTTAPELTPLFGQALAGQVAQILAASQSVNVLEFGAGTGALAAALIPALQMLGLTPHYYILEVSAALRQRQQARLLRLSGKVQWLDRLPTAFEGCVLANEVLDAMPVTLFRWTAHGQLMELGVCVDADGESRHQPAPDLPPTPFYFVEQPADAGLREAVLQRMPALPGYQSEINFQAESWVRQMGAWLRRGAALLIDYGFPRHEYYHPQRMQGTLMCHFRHHAHAHPLVLAGLQDITAHVDFSAMARAAREGGLDVLGYTSQAHFLMNAGLTRLLSRMDASDTQTWSRTVGPVQRLLSEAEMGELFKVMALGRGVNLPLTGFGRRDRRARL